MLANVLRTGDTQSAWVSDPTIGVHDLQEAFVGVLSQHCDRGCRTASKNETAMSVRWQT